MHYYHSFNQNNYNSKYNNATRNKLLFSKINNDYSNSNSLLSSSYSTINSNYINYKTNNNNIYNNNNIQIKASDYEIINITSNLNLLNHDLKKFNNIILPKEYKPLNNKKDLLLYLTLSNSNIDNNSKFEHSNKSSSDSDLSNLADDLINTFELKDNSNKMIKEELKYINNSNLNNNNIENKLNSKETNNINIEKINEEELKNLKKFEEEEKINNEIKKDENEEDDDEADLIINLIKDKAEKERKESEITIEKEKNERKKKLEKKLNRKSKVTFDDEVIIIKYDQNNLINDLNIYNNRNKKIKYSHFNYQNYLEFLKSNKIPESIFFNKNKTKEKKINYFEMIRKTKNLNELKKIFNTKLSKIMQRNIDFLKIINEKGLYKQSKHKPLKKICKHHCKKFIENPNQFFSDKLCDSILNSYFDNDQKIISKIKHSYSLKNNKQKKIKKLIKKKSCENFRHNLKINKDEKKEDKNNNLNQLINNIKIKNNSNKKRINNIKIIKEDNLKTI